MSLSAPVLVGPIVPAAERVLVRGAVRGAVIELGEFATRNTVVIAEAPSNAPDDDVITVPTNATAAGRMLFARQRFGGETSAWSDPVHVVAARAPSPPRLLGPIIAGSTVVRVDGLWPGSSVEILQVVPSRAGITHRLVARASAAGGVLDVSVPALVAHENLVAVQSIAGQRSTDSPRVVVEALPAFAPLPEIEGPLYEGQRVITLTSTFPSSEPGLVRTNEARERLNLDAFAPTASTTIRFHSSGLEANVWYAAITRLSGGAIETSGSIPIPVDPLVVMPAPVVRRPIFSGGRSVEVSLLVPGATVEILDATNTRIGVTTTATREATVMLTRPLAAMENVQARATLGSRTSTSEAVAVAAAVLPPAPRFASPLHAAAPRVKVLGCSPGAIVEVHANDGIGDVLVGHARVEDTEAEIEVTPLLVKDSTVRVRQLVGDHAGEYSPATTVTQITQLDRPVLPDFVRSLASVVRVTGVTPGARVEIRSDDQWLGAVDATEATCDVPLHWIPNMGTRLHVSQSLGTLMQAGDPVTTGAVVPNAPPPSVADGPAPDVVVLHGVHPGLFVEIGESAKYNRWLVRARGTGSPMKVRLPFARTAGSVLRIRQFAGLPAPYAEVAAHPVDAGRFATAMTSIRVPLAADTQAAIQPSDVQQIGAVVHYPLTDRRALPIVVYGHGWRHEAHAAPGTSTDFRSDFFQMNNLLSFLATYGFVCVAPDLSVAPDDDPSGITAGHSRGPLMRDAVTALAAEALRPGSPIRVNGHDPGPVVAIGHSRGGAGAAEMSSYRQRGADYVVLIEPASLANLNPNRAVLDFDAIPASGFNVAADRHVVKIPGANHFGFTDAIRMKTVGESSETEDRLATIAQADQQRIMMLYTAAFLDWQVTQNLGRGPYFESGVALPGADGFGVVAGDSP